MGIYEIDAKVKELRELRNMEAEVKSAITVIEDSLKAEMLAKNTDVLSGKDYTMPRRPVRHSRRAGAHTVLTAMAFGNQGIQARIRPAFQRHS